jgi:hypothetical protein
MERVAKRGIDTYHDRERFVNECGRNSNTPTQANYRLHPKNRKNPQKLEKTPPDAETRAGFGVLAGFTRAPYLIDPPHLGGFSTKRGGTPFGYLYMRRGGLIPHLGGYFREKLETPSPQKRPPPQFFENLGVFVISGYPGKFMTPHPQKYQKPQKHQNSK